MIEFQRMLDYVGILLNWLDPYREGIYTCNMVRPINTISSEDNPEICTELGEFFLHQMDYFFFRLDLLLIGSDRLSKLGHGSQLLISVGSCHTSMEQSYTN